MARNINQLFIKGDDKPWAEVITNQYGTMSVLVHSPKDYDEPMQIIIPSSEQAAACISTMVWHYPIHSRYEKIFGTIEHLNAPVPLRYLTEKPAAHMRQRFIEYIKSKNQ